MTQYNLPVFTSPTPGGIFLKDNLEPWRDAVHSMHAGVVRPDYVVPQMMWIDTSSTPWVLKVFQGSDDIVLGNLDPVTLNFTPSAVDGGTVTGMTAGNVSQTQPGLGANVQSAIDGLKSYVDDNAGDIADLQSDVIILNERDFMPSSNFSSRTVPGDTEYSQVSPFDGWAVIENSTVNGQSVTVCWNQTRGVGVRISAPWSSINGRNAAYAPVSTGDTVLFFRSSASTQIRAGFIERVK